MAATSSSLRLMTQNRLAEQLRVLPQKPGVYIFQDGKGNVLYVGKAVSLRQRVRSYFAPSRSLTAKLQRLVEQIRELEFFVTGSEQEALILECNLIKQHRPPYNVCLRDDKTYPYLKIGLNEDWPRVYLTRRLEQDGGRYFGPFTSVGSLRQTLSLLRRFFPFRTCKRVIVGKESRPCLDYHLGRCLAPCVGASNKEEYNTVIRQIILFLEGKQEEVTEELRGKMEDASQRLDFERAAMLRDQIEAMEKVIVSQRFAAMVKGDQDAIAFAEERNIAYVEVFFVRSSKLVGREHFLVEGAQDEEQSRVMEGFIKGFYQSAAQIPPGILLQHGVQDTALISAWLGVKRGARVTLRLPRKAEEKRLVQMVAENAQQGLEQLKVKQLSSPEALRSALEQLGQELDLPGPPQRIECYDVSDIRGSSAVGSMVVFEGGRARPAHYRRFKIKTVSTADDYAMMKELLGRRFGRIGEKANGDTSTQSWGTAPDLVLIDGGKGHLGAALEVAKGAGVDSVPIASIAKEREEIYLPHKAQPLRLPSNSSALYLMQRIRDEAHRFALGYHRKIRRNASLISVLDEISGIGPKRKRALLHRFGSVLAIKQASLEELTSVPGVSPGLAVRLQEHLQR